MKRKFSVRLICLLVAGTVLSGALAVSAFNGSPYEVLKDAIFNAMFYENFTAESEFTMRVNGQIVENDRSVQAQGHNRNLSLSYAEGVRTRMDFSNGDLSLSMSNRDVDMYGRQWYTVTTHDPRWRNLHSSGGLFGMGEIGDRESNYIRLYELFIDLMVGDLRHNMYMTSQGDGTRRVSGAITGSQLPEIVRVLIDIAVESDSRDAATFTPRPNQESWEMPMRELTINRIDGTADIDSDGNLLYIRGGVNVTLVNIFGEVNVVEAELAVRFSDLGTSFPQSPIFGAEEMFTPAFMFAQQNSRYASLMFRLDEFGNICTEMVGTRSDIRDAVGVGMNR
ncbi:MAG: hypothetical protein FWF77_07435 [Defluviitaleaceae bacterium]|nr:hypothetical protein [Defluviitaleaceae bacterium]